LEIKAGISIEVIMNNIIITGKVFVIPDSR